MMTDPLTVMHGRYLPINVLGTGTYGQVIHCSDTITGKHVAVKIAHRDPAFRRSALNEIRAMQLLSNCDDALRMLEYFENDGHICIVSELLHKNFYEVLCARRFQPLSLGALRKTSEHILRAVAELHKNGYIHCDIKPENIMLRRPSTVEDRGDEEFETTCLIDFGAVRQFHENTYFDIQSLWYRAPEVLLGVPYTPKIDSWSIGCLLFELYTGKPLFPGDNPQRQMANIVRTVGMPPLEMLTKGTNASKLQLQHLGRDVGSEAELCCHISNSRGNASTLHPVNVNEEAALMILLCQLLHPDPSKRLDCADAMYHPFMKMGNVKQQCDLKNNSFLSSSGNLIGESFYSCGLSPVDSDLQSFTYYGHVIKQSIPSQVTVGNCNSFPVTVVGSPPGALASTPRQHHPLPPITRETCGVTPPSSLHLRQMVYSDAPTAVAQSAPFHVQPPQTQTQQKQRVQHLQPRHSFVPMQMPHPCQYRHNPSMNEHQQNCVNIHEYPMGCCQQALLQIVPYGNALGCHVRPAMLPLQAFAAQPLACANVSRRDSNGCVMAYGMPMMDSVRGVVYASL